jgi:hypothetical protein
MQDPDTPLVVVEEGEASVGADVVRPIVVEPPAVTVNNRAVASTRLPWTIAIEPQ